MPTDTESTPASKVPSITAMFPRKRELFNWPWHFADNRPGTTLRRKFLQQAGSITFQKREKTGLPDVSGSGVEHRAVYSPDHALAYINWVRPAQLQPLGNRCHFASDTGDEKRFKKCWDRLALLYSDLDPEIHIVPIC